MRFRFREIDEEKKEWVVPEALTKFPEIALNPLRDRVLSCFDVNKDGKIDFKEFISVMSVFSADGPRYGAAARTCFSILGSTNPCNNLFVVHLSARDQKLRFAFNMHDFDGNNKIDRDDLLKYLRLISASSDQRQKKEDREEMEAAEKNAEEALENLEAKIEFHEERMKELKKEKKDDETAAERDRKMGMHQKRKEFLQEEKRLNDIVAKTLEESSTDEQKKFLSLEDFKNVVERSDFQAKLVISLV